MKRNILYLGKFYPKNLLKNVVEDSKGKIGMSNHNFEMSMINGLCQQSDIDLKCIVIPGIFSFPHNNNRFFTSSEHYSYKNTIIHSVSFCNLVVIKEIWSTLTCAFQILKCVRAYSGNRIDVIMNTPNNRFFNALRIAKRFTNKHFTTTVIIPDIPSMVTSMDKQNPLKSLLLHHGDKSVMKKTSNSDGVVLLTEAMMDFISNPLKHIVMEGIVDVDSMNVVENESSEEKQIILYTGTLRRIFGIMNLVNAFMQIPNNDVELWICGSGDSKADIEAASIKDKRIKFFGLVDSQTALRMQHQATVLVNPRTSEGEYTKYSFPSKTMEYLLAGKSVVINKLPGIPEEYYQYVYTPENESVEAFANCLISVLNMDKQQRFLKAMSGRNFIMEQKNSVVQMRRVLSLIEEY